MRLKYQLFLTLLLASATLIAALYAFNNWSFNRGFLNYINQSRESSLQLLSEQLAEGYVESGNWNWVIDNPRVWRRLSDNALRQSERRADRSDIDNRRSLPAPVNTVRLPRKNPPPPRDGARRSRTGPLLLADINHSILVGNKRPDRTMNWWPVKDNNTVIGYIGYAQADRLPGALDLVFANQQKKNFAWASLIMIALSAALAALLATRIVKPVLNVSKAVGKINRGDYAQRISSTRKDELGDLTRDVNQLAHTLEQNRSARQRWIAEISHELRTPVAILQGELEAIEDEIRPFDTVSLASLQTETHRLGRIISDLHDLTLSDIGALEYKMEPMNVATLLQERLLVAEDQCKQAQIDVNLKPPLATCQIVADSQRIGQLIDNLLQNSLRYTDTGGCIEIRLSQQADHLQLHWMDSSPGILDSDLPQLFDPLYRAEKSRNREHGGAGLGLAIVKKIVIAHQGEIKATHSELGGLAVTVCLPV